ncbi:hypothetical protein [Bradyrhizobium sp. HKCCYLS20291]|uniref:hypothetical protein n=1 Tax=Bradyrhizobium sp. HKCCYLS20291 TaxID=3420766 RepID=UPI003EBFA613
MARDFHKSAGAQGAEKTGGTLSGLFADENEFDRRAMWRLGWWGAGAVGAVGLAVVANQAAHGLRQDRISSADLSRQAKLIQSLARETQGEARQLGAAIETLNTDRDRLFARVTVLEQGLESVTGTLAKQSSQAAASPAIAGKSAPPAIAAVETQPSSPSPSALPAFANMSPFMAAPSGAPGTASQPASAALPSPSPSPTEAAKPLSAAMLAGGPPPAPAASPSPAAAGKPADGDKLAKAELPAEAPAAKGTDNADVAAAIVQKTEFAVDLGGANSIGGLRAMWRGLSKANPDLAALRPIIILKEGQAGPGMQLRLGAGPLGDAAAAARICAALAEQQRPCETTVYDGQRLAIRDEPDASETVKPAVPAMQKPLPAQRRRVLQPQAQQRHGSRREEPPAAAAPAAPPAEAPKPEQPSALSSFFRRS